jgi:tRNA(adenine34) deaminase
MLTYDEKFMKEAFKLARTAVEHGNEPFGAVLVKDGSLVMGNENQIHTSNDPTFHAELGLIRNFCSQTGITDLSDYTLYTSCEPCFMCSGAMVWAKLGRMVFGAYDKDYCEIRGFKSNDCSQIIFDNSPVAPTVTGGILREEGIDILKLYFCK